MSEDKTTPRTLWTQTLLDILESAIKQKKDKETLGVLKEFRAKGYGKAQILNYANKQNDSPHPLDSDGKRRIKKLQPISIWPQNSEPKDMAKRRYSTTPISIWPQKMLSI